MINCERIDDFLSRQNIVENFISQSSLLDNGKSEIVIQSEDSSLIKSKVEKFPPAKVNYTFKNGLNPGNIKDKLITRIPGAKTKRIIWGKDIQRYNISWGGDYIIYDEHIADNLTLDDIQSKKGMKKQTKIDFALRDSSIFEREKLVVRKTGDRLISSYDDNNYYFDTLVHGIYQNNPNYDLKYLLVILNSTPATFFYRCLHDIKGKVFAKISLDDLSNFPVPPIADDIKPQISSMIESANLLLSSNKDLQEKRNRFLRRLSDNFQDIKITGALATFDQLEFADFLKELKKQKIKISLSEQDDWEIYFDNYRTACQELSAQIATTNNEIDLRVYKLYGLTYDEVLIVDPETPISREEYEK